MSKLYIAAFLVAFLSINVLGAPFEELIEIDGRADVENYRLPTEILPWNYDLKLRPYLQNSDGVRQFTFDGEVTIEINSTINTNTLILHSRNLNYTTSEYWAADAPTNRTALGAGTLNSVTDKLQFNLSAPLEAGRTYYLHFVYVGTMDDDMHGFYRSYYLDADNNRQWIGSTQFQTHHARRAFPSFDEPKFKATFNVTIRRHRDFNSFGNTRIAQTTDAGEYQEDLYQPTPRMSTYLLAFLVSKFDRRNDTNFGVIARPEYYNQTEYSFNVGRRVLSALSNYFGINYYEMGNDKMDMAAIPDFSAGAMENWGLLTYRERALLYDQNSTTLSARQSIAAVVAHEQTHMWFGDLVTCDWWSYTWLNEGFARYFQYFGTAMVETDMGLDQQFIVDQLQSVMNMDSTNSTNPMSDPDTNTPSDLSRMFNSISYNKGASIIRMVRHAMGEENFRNSLTAYLNRHAYTNTVPNNLLEMWLSYWPNSTNQYAEAVFRSFTEQVGYPVITVTVSDNKRSFSVRQERFLLRDQNISNTELLYTVPISYTTSDRKDFSDTTPKFYLEASTATVSRELNTAIDWIILNVQESGYYRVNYDEKTWDAIHASLHSNNWGDVHELNRAQIVDDLLNFARAGILSYEKALEVLEYLESETNYLPWTSAFTGYTYINIRLGSDTEQFADYIQELTETVYEKLGFDESSNDTALDIYNRARVLSWACKFGKIECISKAREYFANINTTPVPVNIRSVVYCNALRYGNESDYDLLFNKFNTSTSSTEQTLILGTLGCVRNETLVEKYFNAILSDDIRRQDKSNALSSLYTENNENVAVVFKLVTENVDQLIDALGSSSSVATVISNIAARFTTASEQQSLRQFNEQNSSRFGSSASTLLAAERAVEENLAWASSRLGSFRSYLSNRKDSGAATNTVAVLTMILCATVSRFLQ